VGAARRLARYVSLALLSAAAHAAAAERLEAVGACRDGVPNGAYELYQPDGRLRAVGAFAQGRKTGTFIFWNSDGARLGVIPYNDDVRSGTIALWYTKAGSGRELRPKSETPYVQGRLHGIKRSWYRSGRPKLEARYEHGIMQEVQAWSEDGLPLSDAEGQGLAASELAADDALYTTLDELVRDHAPRCG
jgi:antitoxin component YwqK of YwqJK toxin-antitoxin module